MTPIEVVEAAALLKELEERTNLAETLGHAPDHMNAVSIDVRVEGASIDKKMSESLRGTLISLLYHRIGNINLRLKELGVRL